MREAYGRRSAFLCGWACLMVSRDGSIAAQAVSTAIFFNSLTDAGLGPEIIWPNISQVFRDWSTEADLPIR
jgi:hypothetical protein